MTRITGAMITNTTIMHVQRNMRNLDEIIRQIETTQRIQRPSDDPVIASRALKFRTNQAENEQFQRNVLNGMAWMNVTESTFNNVNSELLRRISELAVQGANDTLTITQKQGVISQIQSFFQQIGHEMNQTYAGSHLFSGLRTDEPPVFNRDNNRSFAITQHFNIGDIARGISFQRLPDPGLGGLNVPRTRDINVINLAFRGLDTPEFNPTFPPESHVFSNADLADSLQIPGFYVRKLSTANPAAYYPIADFGPNGAPLLHFIHETGELVMSNNTATNFPREGVAVTYRKTGFRQGDINPSVYFTAREIITDPTFTPLTGAHSGNIEAIFRVTEYFSRESNTPQVPGVHSSTGAPGLMFPLSHAFMPNVAATPEGLRPQLPVGAEIQGGQIFIPMSLFDTGNNISVSYAVVLNPATTAAVNSLKADLSVAGVELVRATATGAIPATATSPAFAVGNNIPINFITNHRYFDMHNQNLQLEFATHTHVSINSLAKNVLTDKMFADFRRLFEFSDSLHITPRSELEAHFGSAAGGNLEGEELERAIANQITSEEATARAALFTKMDNMLRLIDRHADNASREQTLLGSRMVRMDLLQSRLEQDAVTFELLSRDNEATDIPRALILKASAEAAFMASLRANSGVVQMSLAQFIN